jgi:hypothetical protein
MMGTILESISEFLDDDGWNFESFDDDGVLRARFAGASGEWDLIIIAREEQEQAIFYSHVAQGATPEHRRREMCEFLNRLNNRTVYGAFEMDMRDGETMFRTALDLQDVDINDKLIRNALYTNLGTMERYHGSLVAVMEDDTVSAEVALAIAIDEEE